MVGGHGVRQVDQENGEEVEKCVDHMLQILCVTDVRLVRLTCFRLRTVLYSCQAEKVEETAKKEKYAACHEKPGV